MSWRRREKATTDRAYSLKLPSSIASGDLYRIAGAMASRANSIDRPRRSSASDNPDRIEPRQAPFGRRVMLAMTT